MVEIVQVPAKPAEFALVSEVVELGNGSGDCDPGANCKVEVARTGRGDNVEPLRNAGAEVTAMLATSGQSSMTDKET